jgi:hypothetical protein
MLFTKTGALLHGGVLGSLEYEYILSIPATGSDIKKITYEMVVKK